ncbi:MAG: SusC/RagA family TonB-linked outer membrane protein [Bacteroidales bacterium]|nr:MAG: SusC/RagA family TonB-linked outer membrane protein [Bacteroidales bacterium]
MLKKLFIVITCFLPVFISGQSRENIPDKIIHLEVKIYTLNEILEVLVIKEGVNLTYNSNELPVADNINIVRTKYSLKELLDLIAKQLPVEYTVINQHIILKKRKLEKNYRVTGNVTETLSGETLAGVNIYVKESLKGCISDYNGKYILNLSPGQYVIVYSYMGFKKQEVPVNLYSNVNVDISLDQSEQEIEEVRISAQRQFFGNLEKGRSIQKISLKEIQLENINNVSDVLHARLSGIWATKTSGAPGDHVKIRVRGLNSLFASDDPLYVVDGVQIPNVNLKTLGITHLNIHDVDNITVLKDASSTALYGYQGGNGVVIIDTRRGGGKNEISFTSKIGVQRFTNMYDLMNTEGYLASMDSSLSINNIDIRRYYPEYADSLESTDWQDFIFQDGLINEYQLSASGSKFNTKYYLSANYYSHEGIVKSSSYDKMTFSANLGRKIIKNLNAELSLKYSYQENNNNLDNYLGNELLYIGINRPPCLHDIPDSLYRQVYTGIDTTILLTNYLEYSDMERPYEPNDFINNVTKQQDISIYSAHLFVNYRIKENINFNFATSFSSRNQQYILNQGIYEHGQPLRYYIGSDENYLVFNHQYNLSYNKILENHSFRFIAGIKSYTDNVYWNTDSINYPYKYKGTPFDVSGELSKGTMAIHGLSGAVIRSINSYVSHLNYSFKNRYNISLAVNFDHLKEGSYLRRKDIFTSVALNWDLAKEPWFDLKWFNECNIFTNYGTSGNYPLNALSNDLYEEKGYTYIDTNHTGYAITQLANHHLKHEEINEINFGIRTSLFNQRLKLEGSYFNKVNSDLIINREIPLHYGGGHLFLNIGKLENKGIDLGMELIPVKTLNFLWYSRANISFNNQKIRQLDIQDTILLTSTDILFPDFIISRNGNLGNIYLYKYMGKYTEEDRQSGSIKFREISGGKFLNADTITYWNLDENDKVVVGNSLPDFTWNFYSSFVYKNFSVDMLWYGVAGIEKYNATRAASYLTGTNPDINQLIYDSISVYNSSFFYRSSYFVENAGFARLKYLTFSYSPKKRIYNHISMKFSLSFENLVTITKYKGHDPETTVYTDNTFSDYAVDRGAYPIPKAVYGSINLTF